MATQSRKRMKAAAIDRFGGHSRLKVRALPRPEPGSNEVLIKLHTAGIGVWDVDVRQGYWPSGRPKFPLVLGTDGAGTVAAKAASVRRFDIGERVWAYEFANPKGGFTPNTSLSMRSESDACRGDSICSTPVRRRLPR